MKNYSKQREAVVRALAETKSHPTAEALYGTVKKILPNISLATVYRNLRKLHDEGDIIIVRTGDTERFDFDTTPHAHFKCTKCGSVSDVPLTPKELAEIRDISDHEFQLNFSGICENCIKKETK